MLSRISKPIKSQGKCPLWFVANLSGLSAPSVICFFWDRCAADFLLLLCSGRTYVMPSDSCAETHKRPRGLIFSQLAAARGSTLVSPCLHVRLLCLAGPAMTLGCTSAPSEDYRKWQTEGASAWSRGTEPRRLKEEAQCVCARV